MRKNILNKISFLIGAAAKDGVYNLKTVNFTDAIIILNEKCSIALNALVNKKQYLYRGMSNDKPDSFLITPKTRISQNTSNVYTRLMSDILPSWKGWPKRNKSIICTNDVWRANNYGEIYIIFPFDGTDIAICPTEDIWDSFDVIQKNIGYLSIFNDSFLEFLSFDYKSYNDKFTNYEFNNLDEVFKYGSNDEIINIIKDVDYTLEKILEQYEENDNYKEIITKLTSSYPGNYNEFLIMYLKDLKTLKKTHINILEYLNNLMEPKKNRFKLKQSDNLPISDIESNEMWFSNTALFINEQIFKKNKERILGQ